ncbi:MAG TPA: TIGR03032 family protein [Gammaproteobacteria bacterium]|jgi:uncharacterized protein (TIGR03032 family)|nr:TIGR03032 family protein [Gammaproteobacteria bacterium]
MGKPTEAQAETGLIPFRCEPDEGFIRWLSSSGGSIVLSTYQAGILAFFGWNGHQVTVLLRRFEKCMGLDVAGDRLALATRRDLMVFGNSRALAPNFRKGARYDALYIPRQSYHMPELAIHDVGFVGDEIWMVNTRFNCLASPSDTHTFRPRWRPPFIKDLGPDDRCHLNGMAVADGAVRYVTAMGTADVAGSWREHKADGGVVMEVPTGEVVLGGLAMPHSPRLHRGELYVLDSGKGLLLKVDAAAGKAETVVSLPGYLRGLSFVGDHALVGMCQSRETAVFGGMPVQTEHEQLLCGIAIVDLRSGHETGRLLITSGCTEVYDLRFLAAAPQAMIVNLEQAENNEAISVPDCYYWLRPENEIPD